MNRISTLVPLLLLAACGGGGGDTPEPPPEDGIYATAPDLPGCMAGTLKNSERQAVLAHLNQIRARHGLPATSYDSTSDAAVTAAALIMAANNTLTHEPTADMKCYSATGASGAAFSNLYWRAGGSTLGVASTVPVDAFLLDDGVDSLGHRRWLLDPFLGQVAFGRVDGTPDGGSGMTMAAALKVIGGTQSNVAGTTLDYVADPEGDYPASLVDRDWFLSFSVVANRTSRSANGSANVDFSDAVVEVSNGFTAVEVTSVSYNYTGYGLPNIIQWKVPGLQTNTLYSVRIAPVRVNGEMRSYQYSFTLKP